MTYCVSLCPPFRLTLFSPQQHPGYTPPPTVQPHQPTKTGLYLTDILLNFESMYKPLLRLFLMLLSLGLTLGIEFAAAARNPLQ